MRLSCPFLECQVELTDERAAHIQERHPELAPQLGELTTLTLRAPDLVRRSTRQHRAWLLSRWYDDLLGGKHVVVVVMRDPLPFERCWVITAYVSRRISGGIIVWQRR